MDSWSPLTIRGNNNLTSFTDWASGSNNIVYDSSKTLFVNAAEGDYHLVAGSQAIDKGNNSLAVDASGAALTTDLDGNARIWNGTVDIGAYEYSSQIQLTTPTLNTPTVSGTTVSVSWSAVSNATKYQLEYKLSTATNWTTKTVTGTSTTFTGESGKTYNVQVKAIGDNTSYTDSSYSSEKTVTIPQQPTDKIQKVYASADNYVGVIGQTVSIPVMYEVLDGNTNLNGLMVRVHYDSSVLTYNSYTQNANVIPYITPSDLSEEEEDIYDENTSTDRFITITWGDPGTPNAWPGLDTPLKLITLNFTINNTIENQTDTTVSFSGEAVSGYKFQYTDTTVTAVNANFDIDGDGQLKLFTDALLLYRYMAGSRNDTLINGISEESAERKTASEIQSYIKNNKSVFDIDGDGQVKLFTDALLLYRYLAGSRGDALINGAVSETATRTSATEIINYIKSMKPKAVTKADAAEAPAACAATDIQTEIESLMGASTEKAQKVYTSATNYTGDVGQTVSIPVMYEVLDGNTNLNGLMVRVHYDSSVLEYDSYTENTSVSPYITPSDLSEEEEDIYDENASTDRFVTITWGDPGKPNAWPGVNTPLELITLKFKVKDVQAGSSSPIVFEGEAVSGYKFNGVSATVTVESSVTQLAKPVLNTPTASGTTASVSWSAVSNASGYQLEYKRSTDTDWTTKTVSGTSTTFIGTAGLTYNVRVKALGTGNYTDSEYSTTKTVTFNKIQLSSPTLNTPTASGQTASVSWSAVSNASGYQLEYKLSTANSWTTKTVSGTSTTFTGTAGLTYNVRVKALGTGNYTDSEYSTTKTVTLDKIQLSSPTLNTPSASGTTASVSWSAVSNASSYQLEYKLSTANSWTTKTVSGTSTTFTGQAGKTYNVRVKAIGSVSYSDSAYSKVTDVQIPISLTGVTLSTTSPKIGETITATVTPAGATVTYQWYRGTEQISSATTNSYKATSTDVGYTLRCVASGTGLYAGTVSATTAKVTMQLTTPSLSLKSGNYQIVVTVGASEKAASYLVEYSTNSNFSNAKTKSLTSAGTFTLDTLEHDKIWYFRVKAVGASSASTSDSGWSSVKSAVNSLYSEKEKASTVVTTNVDIVNAYDGVISLREALNYASTGATITFDESLRNQTIVLDGSRLNVTKAVSIQANDLDITIDANQKSSVIYVNVNKKVGTVLLQGLTLTGGYTEGFESACVTLYNSSNVTIQDCVLRDNVKAGTYGNGAAILLEDATSILRMENTSIVHNVSTSSSLAAAIYSNGTMTMLNCEVSQNKGTGVFIASTKAHNIVNCTIVGNSDDGIYNLYSGRPTISNCIVTRNLDYDVFGKATVTNSIVGKVNSYDRPTLKNTQTGVTKPGFTYLPDFANYEEWLNVRDEDWDLTLKSDSTAINYGNNKLLTAAGASSATTDLAGKRRISNKTVDAGAYEYQCSSIASPKATAFIEGKNVYVSWNTVSDAASYNVEYRVAGTTKWTTKTGLKTTFMTFAAKAGMTYEINVVAVSGKSSLDDSAASTTTVNCSQMLSNLKLKATYQGDDNATISVTGLSAQATHLLVKLGNTSAQISTSSGEASLGTVKCVFQNGSLVFTGLTSSTKYTLEVQQMIVESEICKVRSAVTKATIQTTKTCYNTPQNVTAKALSDTQVQVGWSTVTGKKSTRTAAAYTVQYSVSGTNKWSNATTKATGNSYVVSKLKGGTNYEFRVFATKDNSFLASGYSTSVSAKTLPSAPKIVSVVSKIKGQAVLSWNLSGTQKYEVRYCIKGTNNWQTVSIPAMSGKKITYTFTGLTSGKAYEFQVRSIDAQLNTSAWSASKVLNKVA